MANILFIERRIAYNRGGGEQFDLNLANQLKKNGHKIHFLIGVNYNKNGTIPFTEFTHTQVRSPYLVNIWQRLPLPLSILINVIDQLLFEWSVLIKIKKEKLYKHFDFFYTCSLPHLGHTLQNKYSKIRTIVHMPGPIGKYVFRKSFSKLNNLFSNGDAYTINKKHNLKIAYIPLGINKSMFKPIRTKKNKDVIKIVSVGRLVPLKNYSYALDIINSLKEKHSNFIYTIIGDGPEKAKIEDKITKLRLSKFVNLAGSIPNKDLPLIYGESDIFLLTSTYDNLPNVLLEASSCGLPIIATKVGGNHFIVKNNINGYLIPKDNAKLASQYITKLIHNKKLGIMFSKNGINISKKYSWYQTAKEFEEKFIKSNP